MSSSLPPLDVRADLTIDVEGEVVRVSGDGPRLVVELPSLRSGRRLLTSGPFATGRVETIGTVHGALQAAGLTAEVRVRGDVLARLGEGARSSSLARLLRLGGIDVRPARPLATAVRRHPTAAAAVGAGLLGLAAWALAACLRR